MIPVEFKEQNVVYGKDQDGYEGLPALHIQETGQVISCWKLSWKDFFKILFTRKVWLCELTFNMPLQPVLMTVNKNELFTTEEENA